MSPGVPAQLMHADTSDALQAWLQLGEELPFQELLACAARTRDEVHKYITFSPKVGAANVMMHTVSDARNVVIRCLHPSEHCS